MLKQRIYLDNAATTPLNPEVFEVMKPYFTEEFGNPSSIHETGHKVKTAIMHSREQVAEVLHCRPNEIIFTSGGTESDNLALKGVAEANNWKGHIVISTIEHHAIEHTAKYLESRGLEVSFVKVDEKGMINPDDVIRELRDDTILVSIIYANNEIGTIEPISEIGKEVQKRGILMHTDAVQTGGVLSLNVDKLHVDMLSLSGHKFYGPKGVGILYIKNKTEIIAQQIGGGQEFKKRASTESVPSIIGFADALTRADKTREKESKRLTELRDWAIQKIQNEIGGVVVAGHEQNRLPNNISLCFSGLEGEALVMRLSEQGFDTSSGSACTSGNLDPSHVLIACGIDAKTALGSLRVSMGKSTTKEDLELFIDTLKEEVVKLAKISGVVDITCR
jgi:cysteine desulfurase